MQDVPRRSGLSRRQLVQGAGLAGLDLLVGCGRLPRQQPPKPPRLGALLWLGAQGPSSSLLVQGLRELGYLESQNLTIEWRAHQGRADLLPQLVAELVHIPVDLIYTSGTPAALAASEATRTIPIVMTAVGDPVAVGLVASLARPGGNVTGTANLAPQLSGKRLQLLREVVPGLARAGILVNATIADKALDLRETQEAARILGVSLYPVPVRDAGEFESAFAAMARERVEALLVLEDFMFFAPPNRGQLVALAAQHRLPAMYTLREWVDADGLIAYGPNLIDAHRRSASYIDKIFRGTKPADLPVEQPTTFEFVINLRTAQALGITIPQHVLLQATEVIQ
jgi:putative ABC transport system substrate-binding protein